MTAEGKPAHRPWHTLDGLNDTGIHGSRRTGPDRPHRAGPFDQAAAMTMIDSKGVHKVAKEETTHC
jgi:hypothetical protein